MGRQMHKWLHYRGDYIRRFECSVHYWISVRYFTYLKIAFYLTIHFMSDKLQINTHYIVIQFSVPQKEYTLGGSYNKGSHVYFLLQVFWVILLFCQVVLLFDVNVVLMLQ